MGGAIPEEKRVFEVDLFSFIDSTLERIEALIAGEGHGRW